MLRLAARRDAPSTSVKLATICQSPPSSRAATVSRCASSPEPAHALLRGAHPVVGDIAPGVFDHLSPTEPFVTVDRYQAREGEAQGRESRRNAAGGCCGPLGSSRRSGGVPAGRSLRGLPQVRSDRSLRPQAAAARPIQERQPYSGLVTSPGFSAISSATTSRERRPPRPPRPRQPRRPRRGDIAAGKIGGRPSSSASRSSASRSRA